MLFSSFCLMHLQLRKKEIQVVTREMPSTPSVRELLKTRSFSKRNEMSTAYPTTALSRWKLNELSPSCRPELEMIAENKLQHVSCIFR